MTKKKGTFLGTWLDGSLRPRAWDEGPRQPAFANAQERARFEFDDAWAEALVENRLRSELCNQRFVITPGPVIDALREAAADWRFDAQRRETEPEPAQWREMVLAIEVPESPDIKAGDLIMAQVEALPSLVKANVDVLIFRATAKHRSHLLNRIVTDPMPADFALLRCVLSSIAESLQQVHGKRGTKRRLGKPLRLVSSAIAENSDAPKIEARSLAAHLLRQVGIPAPESRSRLASLTRE